MNETQPMTVLEAFTAAGFPPPGKIAFFGNSDLTGTDPTFFFWVSGTEPCAFIDPLNARESEESGWQSFRDGNVPTYSEEGAETLRWYIENFPLDATKLPIDACLAALPPTIRNFLTS